MADYSWFNKRRQRSIDQLRPWSNNPRLNPEEQHVSLRDYIEDIIQEDGDKKSFIRRMVIRRVLWTWFALSLSMVLSRQIP